MNLSTTDKRPRQVFGNIDTKTLDFGTGTWQNLRIGIDYELSEARRKNESLKAGPEKTIELRARIKALNEILALENIANK